MMNKNTIISRLEKLSLEEIEANIYTHLLEKGPRTPLELSRELNKDRSKIYRSIEKLIKKNLLQQSHTDRGKKFQAASPKNITLLIEEKEEALVLQKESLPMLIEQLSTMQTYMQREFEIKHYRGQEGLRQMLYNQLSAEKEIVAFSYKNKNEIVGEPYAEKIRSEQVARKITLYEIENETDQDNFWYTNVTNWEKFYKSRYISPKILNIKQYIAIFNNTVAIINWVNGQEVGLEVINSSYADMQRQLFWKFWEIAEKEN